MLFSRLNGQVVRIYLVLAALLLAGCSQSGGTLPSAAATQRSLQPPAQLAGLPSLQSLGALAAGPRRSSVASQPLNGAQFASASSGVAVAGSGAAFSPAAAGIAFALYRFDALSADSLATLTLALSSRAPGAEIWVGVSNFQSGAWFFHSAEEDSVVIDLEDTAGAFSNGQYFFVAVIAFDAAGFTLETLTLDFTAPVFPGWQKNWEDSTARAICVDGAGNTYVAANYGGEVAANEPEPCLMLKYGPAGELLAAKLFALDDGDSFFEPGLDPYDMSIDADGNLYVNCNFSYWPDMSGLAKNDIVIMKFNSSLSVSWVYRLRRDQNEGLSASTVDGDGNIVLAGSFSPSPGGPDFQGTFMKINPAGELLAHKYVSGVGGRLSHVSVDPATDDIYLSGSSSGVWALKVSGGSIIWSKEWNGAAGQQSRGIAYDGAGGATVLSDEVPNTRYASAEPEPLFLSIDDEGALTAAQAFTSPSARSVVQYGVMSVLDGTVRVLVPWRNIASSLGGTLIYDFPVGDLSAFDGTLWQAQIAILTDFATNGSDYSFSGSSGYAHDKTAVTPVAMQAGSFLDIIETVTLEDAGGTLVDMGGNWSSEGAFTNVDTTVGADPDPTGFSNMLTVGYPAP